MIPLKMAGATVKMVAPEGADDVRTLYVSVIDGCCVSRWEPTPDELAVLNAGGSVELWVQGGQPPVALQVAPYAGGDE